MRRTLLAFVCSSLLTVLSPLGSAASGQVVDSGTPSETASAGLDWPPGTDGLGQLAAQEFSLAQATNVTRIEAYIGGTSPTTVQLTSQIGPGTTAVNVLSTFSLAAPGTTPNDGAWVGQDLNLNLGAGTYFLVFSGFGFLPIDAPLDIGETFIAFDQDMDPTFAPASNFSGRDFTGLDTFFGVRVIPEPGGALAGLSALLAAGACRRCGGRRS